MTDLVETQLAIIHRMSRLIDNMKKLGRQAIGCHTVESRLDLLEDLWRRFENNHVLLWPSRKDAELAEYFRNDAFEGGQELYLNTKTALREMLEVLKAAGQGTSSAPTTAPVSVTQRKLPTISCPLFNGQYSEWRSFSDLFTSLVINEPSLTGVERMHYLKTSVHGEPEQLLRNLPVTEANFTRAWELLRDRYDNVRLLITTHLSSILELPALKRGTAAELKALLGGLSDALGALKVLECPVEHWDLWIVHLVAQRLDATSRLEWELHLGARKDPATWGEMKKFLEGRLGAMDSLSTNQGLHQTPPKDDRSRPPKSSVQSHATASPNKTLTCTMCKGAHALYRCDKFRRQPFQQRQSFVINRGLCVNCLGVHSVGVCQSARSCMRCGAKHHTLLHPEEGFTSGSSGSAPTRNATVGRVVSSTPSTSALTVTGISNPSSGSNGVLLATALVALHLPTGERTTARALLDQGSEASFITEDLAQRLRLERHKACWAVKGIGAQDTGTTRGSVTFKLSAVTSDQFMYPVRALVLRKLTGLIPSRDVPVPDCTHLQGLTLADPDYYKAGPVDLLLGAEVYALVVQEGLRRGPLGTPIAQNTSLGWVLSGPVRNSDARPHPGGTYSFQCTVDRELDVLVRRFWEQEELSGAPLPLSPEEAQCEEHFLTHHTRSPDGRYSVRLPFTSSHPDLGDSTRLAESAFARLEQRLERDSALSASYRKFMDEYATLGHMVPETHGELGGYCLPHHGVLGLNGKIRVVSNGSARSSSGFSLNDHLHVGPRLQTDLAGVITRWRRHRIAFSADIEKMFRQIKVHPADRKYQRVLWRDSVGSRQWYNLTTVTYGLACSPFLACRTLRQLAVDEGQQFPVAAKVLVTDTYVDDILSGGDDLAQARSLRDGLVGLLKAGGFTLKKWAANCDAVLEEFPGEYLERTATIQLEETPILRALGLNWEASEDHFRFQVPEPAYGVVTKRVVLSHTARLFDPLGWLAPVVVSAKAFFQELWLLGLSWDAPLPDAYSDRWRAWQEELPALGRVRIPRWLGTTGSASGYELHAFSDASERAMSAVVYLRSTYDGSEIRVALVTAKTKVAPLKPVTLARLELSAALLAVRLIKQVETGLQLDHCPIHLWTDSTVTLGWVRAPARQWKTYVANRVSEIQTTLPAAHWHHVPGAQNPADCASRGIKPAELLCHPLWWQGPPWLSRAASSWPVDHTGRAIATLPELRVQSHTATTKKKEAWELLTRYSSLPRLLRVTALVQRFVHRLLCNRSPKSSHSQETTRLPSPQERQQALNFWLKYAQHASYEEELTRLRAGASLLPRSSLASLSPFLDADQLLRVGGRLKHSLLAYDEKHPVILPRDSPLTTLLIRQAHITVLHGGTQMTLGYLRQRYWIPSGRRAVRQEIHKCIPCFRQRAQPSAPLMASLPPSRVTPTPRAFYHVGVDYAGPLHLVTSKGRGRKPIKGFIALFVCLATRAVHLEAVSDYSSDAFLAAYHRFSARRGICSTLTSDRGTNFVGADAALRTLFDGASAESHAISQKLGEVGTTWRFNPPAAPHFGGIWESAVKSVKHHLRRVVGEHSLTFEELATLLARVEACLNSRPLQPLTDDPEDLSALTPGHFLIGSALNALPEPTYMAIPENRLSRWERLRRMQCDFWRRWSSEYLHALQSRQKWQADAPPLKVGDLVLVKDERLPPTKWALARVTAVHVGEDARIRVATVRTAQGPLVRPLIKLCRLPLGEQEA